MTVMLIVTHRPLMMGGLATSVGSEHPTWLLGFARTFAEAMHEVATRTPHLAMVDIGTDGLRGLRGLHALAAACPNTPLIVLAPSAIIDAQRKAFDAVAADCIADTDPIPRWLAAVRSALANARIPAAATPAAATPADAIPADAIPAVATQSATSPLKPRLYWAAPVVEPARPVTLSGRQAEVIRLLAEGNSIKQIARRLGISPGTVKTHLGFAYTALGTHNRVEAVLRASSLGALSAQEGHQDSAPSRRATELALLQDADDDAA